MTQCFNIYHQGNKSYLENIPTSGHSIGHNGNNISYSQKWPFHLPQQTNTSAVTHVAVPSAALGVTSAHTNVVIPSTTLATTSANSHCGYTICHSQKISPIISNVVFHLPQTNKSGYSICHNGKKHQPYHNHMANNICQQHPVVANQL